jgi:hypothetical protein
MPQQFTVEYRKERLNQIWNPSFENTTITGSATSATLNLNTSQAVEGSLSLDIVSTSSSSSVAYETPVNESRCVAGLPYVASTYIKNPVGVTRNMRVCIKFYSKDGAYVSQTTGTAQSVVSGAGWTRLSVQGTAPSTSYYGTILVETQVTNGAVGNTATIDAMLLEQTTIVGGSVPDFFDGSTDNSPYFGYWLGTINNSVSAIPTNQWVYLDNVQQISGFIGRQSLSDNFEPSRMNISARYPTGFSLPNTALKVNTLVRVKRVGSTYTMWLGKIRNATVQWAIPYDLSSGVGVADNIDIECEGFLADWGRLQGNGLFVAPSDLVTQVSTAASPEGLNFGTTYTAETSPQLSASEITDSFATWLNTVCATVGATIKDGSDGQVVGIYGRDFAGNLPVRFSDTTNNSVSQVYDSITFDSVSSDFFTQIELNTYSYGDVTVNYGNAPYRTLRQTTYSASIPAATDLSNYLLGIFGDNGYGISEISCKSEAQNSWALDLGYGWWDIIGYSTFVQFRDETFRCTIVGAAFTATPSESRFTYYLADIGLTPYLILDDATAGLLDTNKLGW